MSTGKRHVLVIATQCKSKNFTLDRLDAAARELDGALRDGDIGACEPGLESGESLLLGELKAADIADRIKDAIKYAVDSDATLVLALLGHGFIPGDNPVLYFMGWDSSDQDPGSAVDVPRLLGYAANKIKRGTIGIIDTCTAAAAIPGKEDLLTDTRAGLTLLQLLMAAPVKRAAYDMRMSRALTALLRTGMPRADQHLDLKHAKEGILDELAGQAPIRFDYDGGRFTADGWLAYNKQAIGHLLELGADGTAELTAALRGLPLGYSPPADFAALRDLHTRLKRQPATAAITRALRVTDSLVVAHETTRLLRQHADMRGRLTTARLRGALISARGADGPYTAKDRLAVASSVADTLARVVFGYKPKQADGRPERDCRPVTARFVVALADEVGVHPGQKAFEDWADSIGALVAFNNALDDRTQRHAIRPMRLIVNYEYEGSVTGGWPDKVEARLRCDGMEDEQETLCCTSADKPGGVNALTDAVRWAARRAGEHDARLERIEVALPAGLLPQWQPEEVRYGGRELGATYDVVTRWSGRLGQSPTTYETNSVLSMVLARMQDDPKVTDLHWLGTTEVNNQEQLGIGGYAAIGLRTMPAEPARKELLNLLLEHVPVLLWPRRDDTPLSEAHRQRIGARWHLLPGAFLTAYREAWKPAGKAKPDLIADVRAVWDDTDWLSFCAKLTA